MVQRHRGPNSAGRARCASAKRRSPHNSNAVHWRCNRRFQRQHRDIVKSAGKVQFRFTIHKQNAIKKCISDSAVTGTSFLIRVKLDLLHQARSVVDCADQHFEVRDKLRPTTRQAMANADEDTSKSTNSTRAQHSRGQQAWHYWRERSVSRAKRAMDLAFSTALKRSKPVPSLYTALARSTTPSALQRGAA